MQSDKKLMKLVSKGDHSAFANLVQRHTSRYFALAFRVLQNQGDAEDVVQDAFIKLWQNPRAWKSHKSQFTTWFYRVVLNACHDFQRKHQRSVLLDTPKLDALNDSVHSEQDLLDERQQLVFRNQALSQGIRELPLSQQDALNLVVYCGLPQKQAAQVMGISVKALESLLVRARRSLTQSLTKKVAANTSTASSMSKPVANPFYANS